MTLDLVLVLTAGAFLAAVLLPGILRPLLVRAGVVDLPNDRSSHNSPAIRGAGLAPAVSLILSLLILLTLGTANHQLVLAGAFTTVLGASLVGWVEDVRGIPSKYRAILQAIFGACGTMVIALGFELPLWWVPLGTLVIVTYINVANFMDGINGISGGHGLFVGLHYVAIGLLTDIGLLAIIGGLLTAVFVAFLPWNLIHGRMFLGDVGSYLLGSTIAVLSVIALTQSVHPVAVLGPVAIYLADTGVTLLRRIHRGEKWMDAHRSHVYQQLATDPRAHWMVSLYVSAFGVATGAAGLVALWSPAVGWAVGLPLIGVLSWGYLGIPHVVSKITRAVTRDPKSAAQ